jgi:murein L,D-transpeptidase YafK
MLSKIRSLTSGAMPVCLLWWLVTLVSMPSVSGGASATQNDTWILVDVGKKSLSVMQGYVARRTYRNISIGRGGTSSEKKRGDGKTPLGEFHIVRITADTTFHRFFGLDYPDLKRAERALQTGTINQTQFAAIRRAIEAKQVPPQDTALGGYIGIHGIGEGNVAVHEDFNWTYGCIALTNTQIDDLSYWVSVGTKVIIRR